MAIDPPTGKCLSTCLWTEIPFVELKKKKKSKNATGRKFNVNLEGFVHTVNCHA